MGVEISCVVLTSELKSLKPLLPYLGNGNDI